MPYMVAMGHEANRIFEVKGDPRRQEQMREALDSADNLRSLVERLGLLSTLDERGSDDARLLLDAVPSGVQAAMLGTISNAVERDIPVTFAWKPGYDFELRVWEATEGDVGGITVLLVAPLPRDLRAR